MTRTRYFAIVGAMRTGSNLLERTLGLHEGLVALGELFNPRFIGAPGCEDMAGWTLTARDRDPLGFLDAVVAAHPGRVPGFRIFDGHDPRVLDHVAADPAAARFLLRRSPLDSFLSLRIAEETGQWMLVDETARRTARIAFDGAAFEAYEARLADHYARFKRRAMAAGSPIFAIDYDELQDPEILRGAARFAGAASADAGPSAPPIVPPSAPPIVPQVAPPIAAPIARQNPADPLAKVTNPEALAPYLGRRGEAHADPPPSAPFAALDALLVARGAEVIFAPIPGALDEAVIRALEQAEAARGAAAQPLVQGLTPVQADRRRRRGAFVFTVLRHPATRIRDVFERRVLASPEAPFAPLRPLLVRRYGAPQGLVSDAPPPEATAPAFDAFLDFVADSLAGRAAEPPHPAWAPQSSLLAAYAAETPPDFVARAERIDIDAGPIYARLGLSGADAFAEDLIEAAAAPMAVALTSARQSVIRKIYARDFNRLGFAAMI